MVAAPISVNDLTALQPPDEADRQRRAMFFAGQLTRHSIHLLRTCLDHCDVIDFSGAGKQRPSLKNPEHLRAVKELAALSIWLCMAEQKPGGLPEWLKAFYSDAWSFADEYINQPSSKQVLEWYPPNPALSLTCRFAAVRMCNNLKLVDTVEDAIGFFALKVGEAAAVRAQILREALSKPVPELEELIQQPVVA